MFWFLGGLFSKPVWEFLSCNLHPDIVIQAIDLCTNLLLNPTKTNIKMIKNCNKLLPGTCKNALNTDQPLIYMYRQECFTEKIHHSKNFSQNNFQEPSEIISISFVVMILMKLELIFFPSSKLITIYMALRYKISLQLFSSVEKYFMGELCKLSEIYFF